MVVAGAAGTGPVTVEPDPGRAAARVDWFDHAPDLLVLVDDDHRIRDTNRTWNDLHLDHDALRGGPLVDRFEAADRPEVIRALAMGRGGRPFRTTFAARVIDGDGWPRPYQWSAVRGTTGGAIGLRGSDDTEAARDREAHRNALAAAADREQRQRRAKDFADRIAATRAELLAELSHEVRTPLGTVAGFVQLLGRDLEDQLTDEHRGFLDHISSGVTDLVALLDAGLAAAATDPIEATRLQTVDVAQAVTDAVGGLDVRIEAPPVSAPVDTDALRLRHVIRSLVANAHSHSGGGPVAVRVVTDPATGRVWRVDVVDAGPGIAADEVDAVFEPFYRARTAGPVPGIGIGLAIARRTCRALDLDLVCVSDLGVGSTFSILFALHAHPIRHVPAAVESAPGQGAVVSGAADGTKR